MSPFNKSKDYKYRIIPSGLSGYKIEKRYQSIGWQSFNKVYNTIEEAEKGILWHKNWDGDIKKIGEQIENRKKQEPPIYR